MQLDFQTKPYLRRLMIMDQIFEVAGLYLEEADWLEVEKELMDLYILLGTEIDYKLYNQRLERFREKQEAEG